MKKTGFTVLMVLVALVALMLGNANADDLSIYGEDLYDSDGYHYGVDFYADNNTGADLYAVVYITSQENVNGDCVYGMILLAPYETGVLVGSFVTADYSVVCQYRSKLRPQPGTGGSSTILTDC